MITRRLPMLVFAFVLLASGCRTSQLPRGEMPLRLMTFNIRLHLESDGANSWPHRKEAVASMIRFHGADLAGLQEALPEQLADLDLLLPQYGRFGHGRGADLLGEATTILYRRDRFELLRHDTFWLSETPRVAGSKGWDAAYQRIVTWGELRDRRTGQRFFHFNTHLDNTGAVARAEGARLVLATIEEVAGRHPVIVTGDFNALPDSEPYRLLQAAGLRDSFTVSTCKHHGPTSTWNAFKEIEPARRIDFIFVRNVGEVIRHGALSDTFDGRFPSDHLPVVADVMIGASPAAGVCR